MNKTWKVLIDNEIIDSIIGDKVIIDDVFICYKMPYMSGMDICKLGVMLGINIEYCSSAKISRQTYMKKVLEYVASNNLVNAFFRELFELKRFRKVDNIGYCKNVCEIYWELVHGLISSINDILFFEKCHIEYNVNSWQFSLIDDEEDIKIDSKNINKIDKQYIKRLKNEIDIAIKNGDYESSITKSRTLLEEVMFFGIELKNGDVSAKGNINTLYNQFKTLYNMHQNKNMDKRINNILSGFEKIITSIASIRDENSDSHGAGEKRISIEKYHAELFANSAITLSEFYLSVILKNDQ